jgi:hypothetical protein
VVAHHSKIKSEATIAAFPPKMGVKKAQNWMYPGGNIQRAESLYINGRAYYDDKDPEKKLPRRKHESNFFITINTNRSLSLGDGPVYADMASQAVKDTLTYLGKDDVICQYLKFGPKSQVYQDDRFADVIKSIEWDAAVERGPSLDRLHGHVWMTVSHYSQIQINTPMLQKLFKHYYNTLVSHKGSKATYSVGVNRLPYVHVKLLPQSDWANTMRSYIHKGMAVD